MKIEIGNEIRDIEDGDCYYEGVVVSLKPLRYRINNIVWNGEVYKSMNDQETEIKWWLLSVLKDGKWISVT